MKFAVIAAGEGSRLYGEGVHTPKPLVKVGGEALIDRLLRIFSRCGATELVVICNDRSPRVAEHLRHLVVPGPAGTALPLTLLVRSTPRSMHSFHELAPHLKGGLFCLTTVDTVFREEEFAGYVDFLRQACAGGADGVMGVTRHIDDEKPLFVDVTSDGSIAGFHDERGQCHHVSAGIYGLTPPALGTLQRCVERGESRMRNYQRALIGEGRRLLTYDFGTVFDIDHASDIRKAEAFIAEVKLS